MPRRRGRPGATECPVLKARNLWWDFLSRNRMTYREIAALEGVHERTVKRGVQAARSYQKGLRCREASREPQD
jgi:transposase